MAKKAKKVENVVTAPPQIKNWFGEYSLEVRTEAVKRLYNEKGIKTWDQTFDPNSEVVLSMCADVEASHARP